MGAKLLALSIPPGWQLEVGLKFKKKVEEEEEEEKIRNQRPP